MHEGSLCIWVRRVGSQDRPHIACQHMATGSVNNLFCAMTALRVVPCSAVTIAVGRGPYGTHPDSLLASAQRRRGESVVVKHKEKFMT